MLGRGIGSGKILGIKIWIDYLWLIVFALALWSLGVRYFTQEYPGLRLQI